MSNAAAIFDFTTAVLDSRVTFTRTTGAANPATYVASNGLVTAAANNQARFDYNPTTLAIRGLLIEQSQANLMLRSEDFASANWNKGGASVTSNSTVSPDGATTADTVVENTTNATHTVDQAVNVSASTSYTVTFFAKRASGTRNVFIQINTSGGTTGAGFVWFDLGTGATSTITTLGGTFVGVSASTTAFQNSWYKCTLTFTTNTGNTGATFYIGLYNAGRSYLGDGTSSIYLWGAQLEAGAFATSYIPTTTTALTRNADVATITGANFSSFWQAGFGGTSAQATPSTVSGIRPLVQFDDNTANEIIALRGNTTNPELYIVDGGTPQAQLDAGTIAANTAYSLTGWWDTNDCKARKDSGAVVTDNTATIPTVTQMRIGSDGTNYLNGTIATINYYDSFFGQPIYTRRKNKVFPSLL
jgi:hypothetical protein